MAGAKQYDVERGAPVDHANSLPARINAAMEQFYYRIGLVIGKWPWVFLGLVTVFNGLWIIGLTNVTQESDFLKLFIEHGSRLHAEAAFNEEHFSAIKTRTEAMIAISSSEYGSDIITSSNIGELEERLLAINAEVRYEHNGVQYGFEDLCYRLPTPPLFQPMIDLFDLPGLPCSRYHILDCFQEGKYDYVKSGKMNLSSTYQIDFPFGTRDTDDLPNSYRTSNKPSFVNQNSTYLKEILGQSCTAWHGVRMPENLLYGAIEKDDQGRLVKAGSFLSSLFLLSTANVGKKLFQANCSRECIEGVRGANLEAAQTCTINMYNAYFFGGIIPNSTDHLLPSPYREAAATGHAAQHCAYYPEMAGGLDLATRMAVCRACGQQPVPQEYLDAGEAIVMGYETAFIEWSKARIDRPGAGLQINFLTGRSTSDLVQEAGSGDFILIILGYLLMIVYAVLCTFAPSALWSKTCLGLAAVFSIMLGVGAGLGFAATCGILFTPQIIQVLPFLALGLGVNDMFVLVYTFRYTPHRSVEEMLAHTLKEVGASCALNTLTNIIAFGISSTVPLEAVSGFSLATLISLFFLYFTSLFAISALLAIDARRIAAGRSDCCLCRKATTQVTEIEPRADPSAGPIARFIKLLEWLPVKIFIVCGFSALLGVAFWGSTKLEDGLPISDIVPASSYTAPFLRDYFSLHGEQPANILTGMSREGAFVQLDYANRLPDILEMENHVDALPFINKQLPVAYQSWADGYVRWANKTLNATTDFTDVWCVKLQTYYPRPELFPTALRTYLATDGLSNINQFHFGTDGTLLATSIPFLFTNLYTTEDFVTAIKGFRAAVDGSVYLSGPQQGQPFPCFGTGLMFELYEQYINVRSYLVLDLIYVAIGLAVAGSVFLFHPAAVFILVAVTACIIIEVYGLLYFNGLKINGVCVVNLVLAVGVSVEFVGYVLRAFMISPGTRQQRTSAALTAMLVPTVNGALATFIGIVVMAFAKFPYFKLYFFDMYVLIVFIGLGNGVLLLPTLLSWFGPATLSGFAGDDVQPIATNKDSLEMVTSKKGKTSDY